MQPVRSVQWARNSVRRLGRCWQACVITRAPRWQATTPAANQRAVFPTQSSLEESRGCTPTAVHVQHPLLNQPFSQSRFSHEKFGDNVHTARIGCEPQEAHSLEGGHRFMEGRSAPAAIPPSSSFPSSHTVLMPRPMPCMNA